jgi:hypothetical protein
MGETMSWIHRWRRAQSRRALEAAQRAQQREQAAARQRLVRLAATTPEWNRGTSMLPHVQAAPLLTPGQRQRSGRRP